MRDIYLGLGSNIGDSVREFSKVVQEVNNLFHGIVTASVYRSLSFYDSSQPDYFNTCIKFSTDWPATDILSLAQTWENQAGRPFPRGKSRLARTLDIDILLVGEEILDFPDLKVPHPEMTQRGFVLFPLLEIYPEGRHPSTGLSFKCYLEKIPDQGVYLLGPLP